MKGVKMLYFFCVSRNLQNLVGSMSICLDSKKVKKLSLLALHTWSFSLSFAFRVGCFCICLLKWYLLKTILFRYNLWGKGYVG